LVLIELHYENQSTGKFERGAEVFTADVMTQLRAPAALA